MHPYIPSHQMSGLVFSRRWAHHIEALTDNEKHFGSDVIKSGFCTVQLGWIRGGLPEYIFVTHAKLDIHNSHEVHPLSPIQVPGTLRFLSRTAGNR